MDSKKSLKKDTVKKIAVKKDSVKKDTVKKVAVKKDAVKKVAVKKDTVKKVAVKKDTVKKVAVKKDTVKKVAVKKVSVKKLLGGNQQYIPLYSQTSPDWSSQLTPKSYAVDLDVGINEYQFSRTLPNNKFIVATGLVNDKLGVEMVGGRSVKNTKKK